MVTVQTIINYPFSCQKTKTKKPIKRFARILCYMKIALVIYNYSETKGGVERYTANLARGLAEDRHEIHIFCHNLESTDSKIKFHMVPTTLGFYTPFRVLSFAANSTQMLQEEEFDIIHGFGRTYYQDIYQCGGGCHWEYLKRTHKSMKTLPGRMMHACNPRDWAIMHLEKKSFAPGATKKIICVSNWIKDEVQRYYHVPDEDIEIIYNAVDTDKFTPENKDRYRKPLRDELGIGENDLVVLLVGTGFVIKGLKYALESIGLMAKHLPIKLLVIGRGRVEPYQKQAKRLNIQNRVFFLGARNDVEKYYATSDIFLLPSLFEPFGMVCLEAAATGLPVIVSQNAGVAEVLTNAVDSFLIDPYDVNQAAQKISFLADPVWCENMGKAARATAIKYSFEHNLEQVLKLYREVLEMKQRIK